MRRHRLGATLIECLVYVACLTALGNVLASIYIDMSRLSAHGDVTIERLRQAGEFRELFANAVRQSSGTVDAVGPYRTGADQIVLTQEPAQDSGARRYAVFAPLPDNTGVQCLYLREENGAPVVEFCRLYYMPVDGMRVSCSKTEPGRTLVTLDVGVYGSSGRKRPPQPYRFCGVSRVDGRAS